MTVLVRGVVVSSLGGTARARDLMTMSMGFSITVSIGLTGTEAFCMPIGAGACSLMAAFVMSASGVPCSCDGSGLAVGLGVGNGGGNSSATEARPFLVGAALLRFRGDNFLVGETGSGATLSLGSKRWVGSISSVFLALRPRAFARGVAGSSVVVLRRVVRLGLL